MSTMAPIKSRKQLKAMKNYFLAKNEIRNYTLFCVGINTALRISDILNLKWGDIYSFSRHEFKKHVRLVEQKTRKNSEVFLNMSVIQALNRLLKFYGEKNVEIDKDTYIFLGRINRNRPLSRSQAYRILKEAAAQVGIDGNIGCHSMRKTFGYFATKGGISPTMIMNIFNHSSFPITKRYLGIEQDERDEVFMKIAL